MTIDQFRHGAQIPPQKAERCPLLFSAAFLLISVIVFHSICNYIYLSKCVCLYHRDCLQHMSITLLFHDRLLHIGNGAFPFFQKLTMIWNLITDWNLTSRVYPNFFHLIPAIYTLWTGFDPVLVTMSNMIYYAILVWSVYRIGTVCQSRGTGLLAAVLVSFFPDIYGVSTKWTPDFPCIAFVALSLCFLIQSDFFRSRKYSLLFGFSAGLGIPFRFQVVIFVIGSFAHSATRLIGALFTQGAARDRGEKRRVAVNLFSALTLWILIAGFFMFPNFSFLPGQRNRAPAPFEISKGW